MDTFNKIHSKNLTLSADHKTAKVTGSHIYDTAVFSRDEILPGQSFVVTVNKTTKVRTSLLNITSKLT